MSGGPPGFDEGARLEWSNWGRHVGPHGRTTKCRPRDDPADGTVETVDDEICRTHDRKFIGQGVEKIGHSKDARRRQRWQQPPERDG